jgi:hypothetical protein
MFFGGNKRRMVGILFLASAGICMVVALFSFFIDEHFVSRATRTNGRITQLVERRDSDSGNTNLYPVFVFSDATGLEHTIYSNTGSYPPSFHVGENVGILYLPGAPENAVIDGFIYIWIVPLVTGILAIAHGTAGLVIWFWPQIIERFRGRAQT